MGHDGNIRSMRIALFTAALALMPLGWFAVLLYGLLRVAQYSLSDALGWA